MTEIRSIDRPLPVYAGLGRAATTTERPEGAGSTVGDRVEISDLAKALSEELATAESRYQKIAEIRASIQRGDYLTPEKLDAAISRLTEEL